MSFRFLHAADLHLDSPLRNVANYDGAPFERLRDATREAFAQLVELALAQDVAFVLLAGDLYDRECRDWQTPLFLRGQLGLLAEAGIRTFVVQGNHDHAGQRLSKAYRQQLPEEVHLFSARSPETVVIEELNVAIHGQSHATRSVGEDLARSFPPPVSGCLNLGLLHCNLAGSSGHGNYAPTSAAVLAEKGYDYWALGHIHARRVLREGSTTIVYPGNLQGRHARETGPKGCVLVEVQHGSVSEIEFVALDRVRWEHLVVDAAAEDLATPEDCVHAAAEAVLEAQTSAGRPLVARVTLRGETPAHDGLVLRSEHWSHALRDALVARTGEQACLEELRLETTPPGTSDSDAEERPDTDALRALLDHALLERAWARVADDLAAPFRDLPPVPEDSGAPPAFDPSDPEDRARLLGEVRSFIDAALRDPRSFSPPDS